MSKGNKKNFQCGCGLWTGLRCAWSGPARKMVVVEYMPEHLRASHTAAGNSGRYPANGAVRVAVEKSCADLVVGHDEEWSRIVGGAVAEQYAEADYAYED